MRLSGKFCTSTLFLASTLVAAPTSALAADSAAGEAKYKMVCAACHGANAEGMATFPKLSGLDAATVTERLKTYRAQGMVGAQSAVMWGISATLTDADIDNLAAYITGLPH